MIKNRKRRQTVLSQYFGRSLKKETQKKSEKELTKPAVNEEQVEFSLDAMSLDTEEYVY